MIEDEYRGRLLARAFHDELEKLSLDLSAPAGAAAGPVGMAVAKASTLAKPHVLKAGKAVGGAFNQYKQKVRGAGSSLASGATQVGTQIKSMM